MGWTRVWLVLDGDTLYADRNGDLTEGGERVAGSPGSTIRRHLRLRYG